MIFNKISQAIELMLVFPEADFIIEIANRIGYENPSVDDLRQVQTIIQSLGNKLFANN